MNLVYYPTSYRSVVLVIIARTRFIFDPAAGGNSSVSMRKIGFSFVE